MLIKITDFFRNLPKKQCKECGNEMEEQHECYSHTCNSCIEQLQTISK
ncbi:protein YhfH [Metabacillus malikii]|uniref:ArsR family metal-binding transcriptional regulator n=1 Tax=Metabacillus malikii TaxID=1504265 RepID=A0ABT9ZKB9_9BACI|nr:protein YhfH [Metabacillus malikii]MDQ0232221.1 ArsR family metal-binding transcriptional regulator [Metabacillus malikii]